MAALRAKTRSMYAVVSVKSKMPFRKVSASNFKRLLLKSCISLSMESSRYGFGVAPETEDASCNARSHAKDSLYLQGCCRRSGDLGYGKEGPNCAGQECENNPPPLLIPCPVSPDE